MKLALLALVAQIAMAQCLVHGTVTDASTGKPLASTKVFLQPIRSGGGADILRVSDPQGVFCFDRLEPGIYNLVAVRAGYVQPGARGRFQFTIAAATVIPAVKLELTPAASISGTLLDADGEPWEHADVRLLRKVWDKEQHRWNSDDITDIRADDRGAFRFGRLEPGAYYLSTVGSNRTASYYYSAVSTFERATAIPLEAGQDASVTFAIPKDPEARTLTAHLGPGADRQPKAGVTMRSLRNYGGARQDFEPDGSVLFNYLRPDLYELETTGVTPRITMEVDLTGHDVLGLSLAPKPRYDVSIHVIGGPADLNEIGLEVRDAANGDAQNFGAHVDGDRYLLKGLAPGVYWLAVTDQKGYLRGADLDLREGPPASVEMTFSSHLASLSGRVDPGVGPDRATVICVDEEHSHAEELSRSTRTDLAGGFHFEKVTPGKYRLYAIEGFDDDLWGSPELAAALREKSLAVELGEGEDKAVTVPLITRDDWAKALRKIGM